MSIIVARAARRGQNLGRNGVAGVSGTRGRLHFAFIYASTSGRDRCANTCAKGCTYRKCLSCRKYWLNHVQSLLVLHAFPTVNDMKEGRPVNSLLSVSSGAPDHLSIFNTQILTNAKLDARSGCTAGSHAKTPHPHSQKTRQQHRPGLSVRTSQVGRDL